MRRTRLLYPSRVRRSRRWLTWKTIGVHASDEQWNDLRFIVSVWSAAEWGDVWMEVEL